MKTPRQKALKKNAIFVVILLVLSIVLKLTPKLLNLEDDEIASVFNILFIIGCIFAILFLTSERTRIKRIYCKYCGEKYDYEQDVKYNTSNYTTSGTSNSAKRVANVNFICSCSNCGKKTQFTKKITVATVDKEGNLIEYDQYEIAGKYFS